MLPNWLTHRAYLTPDRPAIITPTEQLTFRNLLSRAQTTAQQLAGLDVKLGDAVAVLMRNSVEFVVMMHAVNMLGATLVPLNTRLAPSEIAWQLDNVKAKLFITDEDNDSTAQTALTERPLASNETALDASPAPTVPLLEQYTLDAVHSIIHTSGTTGNPKGTLITFGNLWWSSVGSALNLGNHADDCWLACMPLFHVGGMSIAVKSVIYGIPMVLHTSFDAAAVNRAIDEQHVTIISVVATMLTRMLDERGDKPYPNWLRCVLLGGGPAPQSLLERCAAMHVPVVQTYGLTEAASQVATLAPEDALRKLGSAGKPLFPMEVRIVADDKPVAAGTVGEIIVRGPSVTPGYINQKEASRQTLRNGWLHTGDVGYLDDEGFLYVVDRRDDLIISGGENVYPAEVEAVLVSHPDVIEAAVIGLSDPTWGAIPAALIKLREGATFNADAIRDYCAAKLAKFKVPAYIKVASELPRTASGKLVRRTVAAQWVAS
jgi:o-succinylbenzoate---CoA ligase